MENVKGLGSARLTVSSSAVTLATASTVPPQGGVAALLKSKGAAVCFTDDGVTTPTASVGMELEAGDSFWFRGDLAKLKLIRRDGSDATLLINYYGPGN